MREPTRFIGYNEPVFDPKLRQDVERYSGKTNRRSVWWEQSPYRYWWEFYRRSDANSVKPKVARDFGEAGTDFQTWWEEPVNGEPRGFYLFSQNLGEPVTHVTQENVDQFLNDDSYVVVALNLRHTLNHLRTFVGTEVLMQRGAGQREPQARYQIGAIRNYTAIEEALLAWDINQQEPSISKADLYARVKGYSSDVRETARRQGFRMLNRATDYIKGVEKGVFPA